MLWKILQFTMKWNVWNSWKVNKMFKRNFGYPIFVRWEQKSHIKWNYMRLFNGNRNYLFCSKSRGNERTAYWHCIGCHFPFNRTLHTHHLCGVDFQNCWFTTNDRTCELHLTSDGINFWFIDNHIDRHFGSENFNSNIIDWFSHWTVCHGHLWLSQIKRLQSLIILLSTGGEFVLRNLHFIGWHYSISNYMQHWKYSAKGLSNFSVRFLFLFFHHKYFFWFLDSKHEYFTYYIRIKSNLLCFFKIHSATFAIDSIVWMHVDLWNFVYCGYNFYNTCIERNERTVLGLCWIKTWTYSSHFEQEKPKQSHWKVICKWIQIKNLIYESP